MMHRTPQQGFTLVETLVAISIITIMIGAPFFAAMRSISAAQNARDEVTANMLAQEGVEYVVKIRNDNYIANYINQTQSNWLNGMNGTSGPDCRNGNKCTVNPKNGAGSVALTLCPQGNCSALNYDSTTGFYNQNAITGTNTKTRFTRYIQVTPSGNNEAKVTCTVTWTTNHINYTTTATEYLENWLSPS